MKYNVHVFAVVRVKVAEVEADSQQEAIEKASNVDLYRLFNCERAIVGRDYDGNPMHIRDTEYAEEITHFLVDEFGDEEYERSQWYCSDGKTVMQDRQCVSCLHVSEAQ